MLYKMHCECLLGLRKHPLVQTVYLVITTHNKICHLPTSSFFFSLRFSSLLFPPPSPFHFPFPFAFSFSFHFLIFPFPFFLLPFLFHFPFSLSFFPFSYSPCPPLPQFYPILREIPKVHFFPGLLDFFPVFRQSAGVTSLGKAADQPGFTTLFVSLKPWRTEMSFNWWINLSRSCS